MNKTKLLSIFSVGLLISNLLLVGFILVNPGPHKRQEPKEVIIKKLRLDKEQIAAYEQLIDWHRSHVDALSDSIRLLKKQLYATLNTGINPSQEDTLITKISALQKRIEYVHYRHFSDIRKLCRPEQLQDYELLTREISSLFMPHPPRR